jgi:hypothetical protein
MRILVVVLVAVMGALIGSTTPAEQPKARLTIYFIGCGAPVNFDVFDLTRRRDLTTTMQVQPGAVNGVQTAWIMLPGGYYDVGAGRLPCMARKNVVMLDGTGRNIVLKGGNVLHLTEGLSGLGGSLPSDDLSVVATCQNWTGKLEYVARVEGSAYYFDNIQTPASCVARMRSTGRDASDLTSTPTIRINSDKRLVVYNFSWPTVSK